MGPELLGSDKLGLFVQGDIQRIHPLQARFPIFVPLGKQSKILESAVLL
jgi:hypothetical protein